MMIEPRNILIVRTDRIGDVVLTIPAVRAVRKAFPKARIALWVSPQVELDSPPTRGDILTRLTGVLSVSFGHRKLLARDAADIEAIPCFGAPDKCEEAACPVTEDAEESGALVISEVQNNPIGSDQTREYLELTNPGGAAVDLTGWRVQDCGGNTAALSGSLAPGASLVVGGSLDVSEAGGARL